MKNFSGASTFLTILSVGGVLLTAALTATATTKASKLIEEAKAEKGDELTKMEIVKAAAPAYIPALVVGVSTIACIFGANTLNKRQQAALVSAYALLDASYREYRSKAEQVYGEGADERIKEEMAKDDYDCPFDLEVEEDGEEKLFYDLVSGQYFSARIEDVLSKTVMPDGLECYILSTPYDIPASYWCDPR